MSMSWACCLFTKPNMALKRRGKKKYDKIAILTYKESRSSGCYGKSSNFIKTVKIGTRSLAVKVKKREEVVPFYFSVVPYFPAKDWNWLEHLQFPYPSFQWGLRCFFVSSITPSNHCQNVKFLPGKLSWKQKILLKRILNRQIAFSPVSPECNMSSSQWCCLSLHTVHMRIMWERGKKRGEPVCSFIVCKWLKLDAHVI